MDTIFEVRRSHTKRQYEVHEFTIYDSGQKRFVEVAFESDDFNKACDECSRLNSRVQSAAEPRYEAQANYS